MNIYLYLKEESLIVNFCKQSSYFKRSEVIISDEESIVKGLRENFQTRYLHTKSLTRTDSKTY